MRRNGTRTAVAVDRSVSGQIVHTLQSGGCGGGLEFKAVAAGLVRQLQFISRTAEGRISLQLGDEIRHSGLCRIECPVSVHPASGRREPLVAHGEHGSGHHHNDEAYQ